MKVADLKHEYWLASKICGTELCTLFYGVTDGAIRRERMRQSIIGKGLQDKTAGKTRSGNMETYAGVFLRLYAEALQVAA